MQNTSVAFVLLLLSFASLAFGQGMSEKEKAFRKSLKGTPFENTRYYGQPIPHVPSKREQDNKNRWIETWPKLGPHPLIRFIAEHELYDELKVSERQRKQLDEIPNPDFVSLRRAVADDSVFAANEERFSRYLADFVRLGKRVRREAEEMTEDILDEKQIARVKEIAFQYYLYNQINPKLAFSYRDVEITDEVATEISSMLKRIRADRIEIRAIIKLAVKGMAIKTATGTPVVDKLGSITSPRLSDESKTFLAEYLSDSDSDRPVKKTINPRRRRKVQP